MEKNGMELFEALVRDCGYTLAAAGGENPSEVRIAELPIDMRIHLSGRFPLLACIRLDLGALPQDPVLREERCERLLAANASVIDLESPMFLIDPASLHTQLSMHFDLERATASTLQNLIAAMTDIAQDWGMHEEVDGERHVRAASHAASPGPPEGFAFLKNRA